MTQCVIYLLRYLSERSDGRSSWLPGLEDPNLSRTFDVMFEHPEAPHSVDSLADEAIMSRSILSERIRATFGPTPISFFQDMILRRAAEHLRQKGETSIEQIAHR